VRISLGGGGGVSYPEECFVVFSISFIRRTHRFHIVINDHYVICNLAVTHQVRLKCEANRGTVSGSSQTGPAPGFPSSACLLL
jgi:hypothetical protein